MEPEGSIPYSQELSTGSYPEPDQSKLIKHRDNFTLPSDNRTASLLNRPNGCQSTF
jgi:hypothetical protein